MEFVFSCSIMGKAVETTLEKWIFYRQIIIKKSFYSTAFLEIRRNCFILSQKIWRPRPLG